MSHFQVLLAYSFFWFLALYDAAFLDCWKKRCRKRCIFQNLYIKILLNREVSLSTFFDSGTIQCCVSRFLNKVTLETMPFSKWEVTIFRYFANYVKVSTIPLPRSQDFSLTLLCSWFIATFEFLDRLNKEAQKGTIFSKCNMRIIHVLQFF